MSDSFMNFLMNSYGPQKPGLPGPSGRPGLPGLGGSSAADWGRIPGAGARPGTPPWELAETEASALERFPGNALARGGNNLPVPYRGNPLAETGGNAGSGWRLKGVSVDGAGTQGTARAEGVTRSAGQPALDAGTEMRALPGRAAGRSGLMGGLGALLAYAGMADMAGQMGAEEMRRNYRGASEAPLPAILGKLAKHGRQFGDDSFNQGLNASANLVADKLGGLSGPAMLAAAGLRMARGKTGNDYKSIIRGVEQRIRELYPNIDTSAAMAAVYTQAYKALAGKDSLPGSRHAWAMDKHNSPSIVPPLHRTDTDNAMYAGGILQLRPDDFAAAPQRRAAGAGTWGAYNP